MKNELTFSDKKRFTILRKEIKDGLSTSIETALKLKEVRDKKLWREEFKSFEEFYQTEYKIERAYASRLIQFAEIKLLPIGNKIETESQARAIAKVPPEKRKEVMDEAEKSGKVTASSIAEAAEKKSPKIIQLDKIGRAIPDGVVSDWQRAEETAIHLRSLLSEVKCAVAKGLKEEDLIFAEIHNPDIAPLEGSHYTLSQVLPYSLCTTCNGEGKKGCRLCLGRGFISKFRFDQCVPRETKDLLLKKK